MNKKCISLALIFFLLISNIMPSIIVKAKETENDLEIARSFNFENGDNEGFSKAWGGFEEGKDGVSYSEDLKTNDSVGSLKVDLKFNETSWIDANIAKALTNDGTEVDISKIKMISYVLYIPNPSSYSGELKLATVYNDPWTEDQSWEVVDVPTLKTTEINGITYGVYDYEKSLDLEGNAKTLILRLGSSGSSYTGPVYLDNIKLYSSTLVVDEDENDPSEDVDLPENVVIPTDKFVWNYEDKSEVDSFSIGWGTGFSGGEKDISYSEDLKRSGNNGALKVDVNLDSSTWKEANVKTSILDNQNKIDTSKFKMLSYDIYIPNPDSFGELLKLGQAFDDTWGPIDDWEDIDLSSIEREIINGTEYAKVSVKKYLSVSGAHSQLVFRISGYQSDYNGPIYIDDIVLSPFSDKLSVDVIFPENLKQITNGSVEIAAQVQLPDGEKIENVFLETESGQKVNMSSEDNLNYLCDLDVSKEKDGSLKYDIVANGSEGSQAKATSKIVVNNSAIDINIESPLFGATLKDKLSIKANIIDTKKTLKNVVAIINGKEIDMKYDGYNYVADVDTKAIADGAYSLFIKAIYDGGEKYSFVDIMIDNGNLENHGYIKTQGTEFELKGEAYYFNGWNCYQFPFTDNVEISAVDTAVTYTADGKKVEVIIPSKTNYTFKQYIDISMMEAKKSGLDVVRTWGFNSDTNQTNSFYTKEWAFNESQFEKFDYIMDSANKHGVRVIITLDNYWGDYGGIASETSYLGLDNILKFYTNSDIKDMYKKYLDNFVNRVNTVNNTKYSDDFSIFSWELMNEPRIDINSAGENNYDENYYNGTLLKQWTEEMAKYIKDIDANHMVSLGSELHGIEVDGTTWGGTEEGYGDDPVANVMSAQGIDFVTFHPYPNANWLNYNIPHVKELIQNVVSDSKKLGKPVVMEEWGIDNRYAIKDFQGNIINPDNSKYEALKNTWNNVILSEFRRAGGNGSLVWSFSSLKSADLNFDIVSFMPGEKAIKDSISVSILKFQSLMLDLLSKNIFIDVDEADRGYINEVVYFKLMDNDGYKFHPENNARVSEVSDALKKLKTISDSNMNLKYLEGLNEDDTISRKDLAKDLYNVLNISKVKLNEEENIRYSDLIDCSSDEIDMIKSLYCAGIFSNESEFRPDDNITRAELAKILTGVMDYLSYEGQGYFDSIVVSGSLPNINVTWSKDEVKDKKIVQTGSYGLLPLIYVGLILMVFGSIIVIRKSDFLNN